MTQWEKPRGAMDELLGHVLATGGIGVLTWDPSDDGVTLRGEAERLLGLAPGVVVGTLEALLATVHAEDRDDLREALRRCVDGGREHAARLRVAGADGSERWLQLRASCTDGDRVLAVCHEVTDDVHSARQIRLAVEAARLGAWSADLRTQVVTHSHVAGFLAGLAPEHHPTDYESFISLVHPEDRARVEQEHARAIRERTTYRTEFRVLRPDGEVRWVHARGEVLADSSGEPAQLVGIDMDITERVRAYQDRRRLERRVQQAQRLESLGVLAGGIAHDFNNLLVGILGNADLALLELPEGAPARASVEDIQAAALRASELTRQMLAYSGRGHFVVRPLDLNALIQEMSRLLRLAVGKGCTLRVDLRPELPPIQADVAQIQQVVMNLITNACEAVGEGQGVIAVVTDVIAAEAEDLAEAAGADELVPGRYVVLEVTDSGCGMDDATRARIFEPFFTTKFTGRGLGLAGVLGIVRGHGGAVQVRSEPGRGTSFKVLFPEAPGLARSAGGATPDPERWTARGTVLVVDDEEPVRSVIRTALEQAGLTVITAADGREGVARFEERADELVLVLLDLTMPELDGEGALRAMQRRRADVPVILMSGFNEQSSTERLDGLAGFLNKPFRVQGLLDVVRAVLDAPRG